ncbi:MAG TPA: peptidoglycan-binding protein LysM [Thermoanaerobaculia bacterium]|nr:peptidoglycan-binding protein LysM [Thermoanaerobaculia bacterium]
MGLIDFAKSVGRKLGIGDDDDKKPQAGGKPQAAPAGAATAQQVQDAKDRRRAAALVKLVNDMGLKVNDLGVRADGDKVTLTGTVASQADREKIVLLVGNTEGTGSVDDQLKVEKPEPEGQYYEVKSGDSLSKIAKQFYGNANKYPVIFEANKPMLKDPDEIYPGQKLRIPPQASA